MDLLVDKLNYIWPFLAVITPVVFIHELGHYLVARINGVRVEIFSVGFGPELLGIDDRHGTRWKICLLPLGGYVKFHGDASVASTPEASDEPPPERTPSTPRTWASARPSRSPAPSPTCCSRR